jgi:TonB family protein
MKYRITISTQTPEISDAEISQLGDFETLLEKQTRAEARRRTSLIVGTVITFLALLIIAILYIQYTGSRVNTVITPNVSRRSENTLKSNLVDSVEREASNHAGPTEHNNERPLLKEDNIYSDTVHSSLPAVQRYEKARPVGGYDSLYQYFRKHLTYPQEHAEDSIEGIVAVSFIIDKDGSVKDIRVQHNMSEVFAQEAVKLIANMPPWQPATMNTMPVASTVSIPIKFEVPKQ